MVRQKVLILLSGKFLEWSQCTHRWWLLWHLSGTMMISPTMIFVVKFWIVVTIGCWLTSFTTSLVLPTIAVHYIRTIPTLYFLDSYVPQHYKPQRSPRPSKPRWPVWLQISLNIILYIILFITFHHPSLLLAASHNIMNLIFYLIIGFAWKVTLVPYIVASKRHQYVANVNCSDNEETNFFGNRVFWWMCESTIKVCSIQLRRYNKFEQGQN